MFTNVMPLNRKRFFVLWRIPSQLFYGSTMLIVKIFLIFISGFIVDLLVTRYTRAIAEKKIVSATALSGIITIANFILLTIILQDSAMSGVCNILAFAGGNSLGTFCAMKKA